MNEQKVENWDGYDIRFVGIDNEWYAVASDIAKALGLTTYKLDQRLDDDILSKVSHQRFIRKNTNDHYY